jgi:two-component system cell cycle response regulator
MSPNVQRRIIVAEDDESSRLLLVRQLERAGYEVTSCANGRQALSALRELGSAIVVADWNMPEMDGLELCQAVQEMRRLDAIGAAYFILLTAESDKEMIVRGLEAGADDYLTKPYHQRELLARIHSGQRLYDLQIENWARRVELEQKNAELDVLASRLEKQANTDALTGVANRRQLLTRLDEAWAQSTRGRRPLCVVIFDIDRFKGVNDAHGHAAGDSVLQAVASMCRAELRCYDVFGRFGGEEFLIVAPDTDMEGAAMLAERVRVRVSEAEIPIARGRTLSVTISLGCAARAAHHDSPHQLVCDADAMLYRAKAGGRNQVWIATGRGEGRRAGGEVLAG